MCAHVAARDVARAPSALSLTLYPSGISVAHEWDSTLMTGQMAGTPAGRWRSAVAHMSYVACCGGFEKPATRPSTHREGRS